MYKLMAVELTKTCAGTWLYTRRLAIGWVVPALFLASASWPALGQWTLNDKKQLPLGQAADNWVPLARDQVHDPSGPAIMELQEPGEGLKELPVHVSGNRVRWAHALDRGAISPLRAIPPAKANVQVLDLDVLLNLRGSFPVVRFPHKVHTQWLGCDNCHEQLFKSQAGANKITMYKILQGEQCGLCHGAVAFPLTQCSFCHSVERPANMWRLQDAKE